MMSSATGNWPPAAGQIEDAARSTNVVRRSEFVLVYVHLRNLLSGQPASGQLPVALPGVNS